MLNVELPDSSKDELQEFRKMTGRQADHLFNKD